MRDNCQGLRREAEKDLSIYNEPREKKKQERRNWLGANCECLQDASWYEIQIAVFFGDGTCGLTARFLG